MLSGSVLIPKTKKPRFAAFARIVEIIRESSTGPKAFEVLYEDFDELT